MENKHPWSNLGLSLSALWQRHDFREYMIERQKEGRIEKGFAERTAERKRKLWSDPEWKEAQVNARNSAEHSDKLSRTISEGMKKHWIERKKKCNKNDCTQSETAQQQK